MDAIKARLPQGGPSALATSEGHAELTMLVMRVRYEAFTASAEASRLTAACRYGGRFCQARRSPPLFATQSSMTEK